MALSLFCMILVVGFSNALLYSSSGPQSHSGSSVIHHGQASVNHGKNLFHQGSSMVINKASTINFHNHEDNIVGSTIFRDDVAHVSPAISKSVINEVSHHESSSINSVTHHEPIDLALHGQHQGHSVSYRDPEISVAHHGASLPVNRHPPGVSVNHHDFSVSVNHRAPPVLVDHRVPAASAPPLPVRYIPNNVIVSNVKSSPSYAVNKALHSIPSVAASYPGPIRAPVVPANVVPVATFVQDVPIAEVNAYAPGTPIGFVKSQYHSQDELGRYAFGYNTGNSAREETRDANGHVRGSYSYVDGNGVTQSRYYTADDKGFRVHGTDIPVDNGY